jgi:D-alanyl-lipoteichoic acid acyltransferase DltB (MBOAT superfamily)
MLFNSYSFFVFLTVVYALFWLIPGWRGKKVLLLVASYFFYAAWNPPYVLILLASTIMDWWLARVIGRTDNPGRRKLLLLGSLACNLGLLGYFKYGRFLLENFQAWCTAFGIHYQPLTSNIVLPIGISFYTFASLSYTVDVYRREIKSDWKFTDYALFVSFLPHLVAGPIVRASVLLPQIENPKLPSGNQVGWGFAFLCFGLVSKVMMADAIFTPVVDRVFAHPERFCLVDAWIAALSFSGQIYYDFSGYSLCAIGLAMCFGFWFPDNFRYPYAASSFSDFWRRWHISLSSWLRDYLYIPLGGNRHGETRTYIALLLTMLIGGLWHGASWMFVLWGGLHGLYLAVERRLRTFSRRPVLSQTGLYLFVFLIVTLTWIPFRANNPHQALAMLQALGDASQIDVITINEIVAIVAILFMIRWQIFMRDKRIEDVVARLGQTGQIALISSALFALYLCSGSSDTNAFIYFQF